MTGQPANWPDSAPEITRLATRSHVGAALQNNRYTFLLNYLADKRKFLGATGALGSLALRSSTLVRFLMHRHVRCALTQLVSRVCNTFWILRSARSDRRVRPSAPRVRAGDWETMRAHRTACKPSHPQPAERGATSREEILA